MVEVYGYEVVCNRPRTKHFLNLKYRDKERDISFALEHFFSTWYKEREGLSHRASKLKLLQEAKNKAQDPPYTCMDDTVCVFQLAQLAPTQTDKTGGSWPTRKAGRPTTFPGQPTRASGLPDRNWSAKGVVGLHIESKLVAWWETRKCGPKTKKTSITTRKPAVGEKVVSKE